MPEVLEVEPAVQSAGEYRRPDHEWLRTMPARGIAEGKAGVIRGGGDFGAGLIRGAAILTRGVLRDGRAEIDEKMLEQIEQQGVQAKGGVRGHWDHETASAESMGRALARVKNWRRDDSDEGIIRADLHLYHTANRSPRGKLGEYVLSLAEEDPDAFGMSIVFERDPYIYRLDEEGGRKKGPDGEPLPPLARSKKLLFADVVDDPAAQEGIFSTDTPAGVMAALMKTPAVEAWFDRWLASRGLLSLEGERMAKEAPKRQNVETPKGDLPAEVGEGLEKVGTLDPALGVELEHGGEPRAAADRADPSLIELKVEAVTPVPELVRLEVARLRSRDLAIMEAGRRLGVEKYAAELCADLKLELPEACQKLVEQCGTRPESQPLAGGHVQFGTDAVEKLRAVAVNGLCLRQGIKVELSAEQQQDAGEFRTRSLLDIGRMFLERNGVSTRAMSRMQLAQAMLEGPPIRSDQFGAISHGTSDFPYVLANVANKELQRAFAEAPTTWNRWCSVGSVPDFKTFDIVKIGKGGNLELVREGGEYKETTMAEAREQGQAATYGEIFSLTRQAIVNDDLGAFHRLAGNFGAAARRLPDRLLYANLLSNAMGPTMGTGGKLFLDPSPVTHQKNWFDTGDVTGFDSTLDTANGEAALNHATMLLQAQRDLEPEKPALLALQPAVLLVPPILQMSAKILMQSSGSVDDYKNTGVINPVRGLAEVVVAPELGDVTYTGYSNTAWYLIANTGQIEVYRVFFLDGVQTPYLEEELGFDIDGRRLKVRLDVGVMPVDRRGIIKSKGAA